MSITNNHNYSHSVRCPAVAGTFYPNSQTELKTSINQFLSKTKKLKTKGILRILIVPHAGLLYSGQTAAWGFKQIEGEDIKNIILLGSSHQAYISGAAVYPAGKWKTPLGTVEVNQTITSRLIDKNQKIISDPDSHIQEHSLEMELIFLQVILKVFRIIPVLLGQVDEKTIKKLAENIASVMDKKTLLVVSTDLSHYPDWETAKKVDKQTISAILTGNSDQFAKKIRGLEYQKFPGVDTCACGHLAVETALKVAELKKITDFRKIFYQNSGDISGDKNRVVGYATIGGWSNNLNGSPLEYSKTGSFFSLAEQKEVLRIARITLEKFLNGQTINPYQPQNKSLNRKLGCFTTLRIKNNNELRGCIGQFEPDKPLWKVIQETAIAAARDPRFPPLTADELENIAIEVSVMTPKKKISDWQKIELGKHGVVIQKGLLGGTFLPQVATETGWSLEEFLGELCSQKADLPRESYKNPDTDIYVFEVQIYSED